MILKQIEIAEQVVTDLYLQLESLLQPYEYEEDFCIRAWKKGDITVHLLCTGCTDYQYFLQVWTGNETEDDYNPPYPCEETYLVDVYKHLSL